MALAKICGRRLAALAHKIVGLDMEKTTAQRGEAIGDLMKRGECADDETEGVFVVDLVGKQLGVGNDGKI